MKFTEGLQSCLFLVFVISNKFITFAYVKYNELFRILKKDGWFVVRQKGSHVIMQHAAKPEQLTIPNHSGKEVKKGLLTAILKQANIKTTKR
jgi:predicted RNA binding protein YcfA (HicA-like mRNA interferase family)